MNQNIRKDRRPVIFQLGFNKCGSRTIHHFFKDNNIPSVHYHNGRLATSMYRHHKNQKPILHPRYNDVILFSDMENIYHPEQPIYIANIMFTKLEQQFPNARFILNTRNKKDWLRSRIAHDNGQYLKTISDRVGISQESVIQAWKEEWDQHHANVLNYFKGNRKRKLIVFHIDRDPPQKLSNFFRDWFILNPKYFGHKGKTKSSFSELASKIIQNLENRIDDPNTDPTKSTTSKIDIISDQLMESPFIRKHLISQPIDNKD